VESSTLNDAKLRRVTTARLSEMKARGEKIAMLTAYDFPFARILDAAGIDVVLVGDSASNVVHGHETSVPITLDQMIDHAAAVVRGVKRALESAIRIMKESGGHAVKMEGGETIIESVRRVVSAGIPVMGHLGLTPQSIYKFGSYTVRAKTEDEAGRLEGDAVLLQEAGCFGLVLEKIPAGLAERVARRLTMPVIGIGAGPGVDGQVLVTHDMLGLDESFSPRFLRRYAQLQEVMSDAFRRYIGDVKSGAFPTADESY
jgi:3-methyl-2-oxobutanoate hydroxymethyltransferase